MASPGTDSSPLEPGDLCQSSDQRDRGQIVIVAEVGINHVSGDTVRVLLTNGRAVYRLRRLLVACNPRDEADEDARCICGGTYVFDRGTEETRCDRCGHDLDDVSGSRRVGGVSIPETQSCRDCGATFPYDADADYCPACVEQNNPGSRTMAKKVRAGRQHARAALDGYRSAILTDPRAGEPDTDALALLGDLLADLLHLADEIAGEYDATQDTRETHDRIVRTALGHYHYESDPANADEAV